MKECFNFVFVYLLVALPLVHLHVVKLVDVGTWPQYILLGVVRMEPGHSSISLLLFLVNCLMNGLFAWSDSLLIANLAIMVNLTDVHSILLLHLRLWQLMKL